MASIHVLRGISFLISKNNSFFACEPRVSLSVYFSTCANYKPGSNPSFSDSLVQKYHIHPQAASQLSSVLATIKDPQKSDTTLSFLVESGFSTTHLGKMLKCWPKLLSADLDKTIKPKIKIFQDFGFSSDEIVDIFSKDPSFLHSSKVIPSLYVLKGLLGSTAQVAKVLKVSGSSWYLKSDLDKNLVPNIDFLMSSGIGTDRISWLVYYLPRVLLQKPEVMKKLVEKAIEMGADRNSKLFCYCVRVASSMSNESWELKVKVFRDMGFTEQDILKAFRTSPLVFSVSEEKLKKVNEVILATGKYDRSCIINNPASLCRSFEKRYKPRIEVFKVLEEKKLIKKWPAFCALYRLSDRKFVERFVTPYYNEVGEVYMSMISPSGKREVNSVPSPVELRLSH